MLGRLARRQQAQPTVTRARVLDGAHLWLTLSVPQAGELVARSSRGDAVLAAVEAGTQTLCLPLAALPGDADADFELLLRSGEDQLPLAFTPPDPPPPAPPSPDGRWEHRVIAPGGRLHLVRAPAPPGATVTRVAVAEDRIELRWQHAAPGDLVVRSADGGAPVATVPAEHAAGEGRALLPPDLLAGREGAHRLEVGDADASMPLRRRRHAVRRPGESVLLPTVTTPDGQGLALRWSRAATLQARPAGAAG